MATDNEIKALKEKANAIKKDTLEFIDAAKGLSNLGIKDAKKMVGFAKENWKSVLGVVAALGIGGALLKRKKKSKVAKEKPAKTAKQKKPR
jgi:hypothetical protein